MDDIDKKILNELQINSNRTVSELAKTLNLPRTTVNNRVNKFEKEGIILNYKAIIDMKKINLPVTALVHIVITSNESVHDIAQKLKKRACVEEVYVTAGQYDIIAKVRLKNNEELSTFIFDSKTGLRSWKSIERTDSMIVLETVKENGEILL